MQRDLEWARREWQRQERRRTDLTEPLPGALGLLMRNKERLREIGVSMRQRGRVGFDAYIRLERNLINDTYRSD